MKQFDVIYDGDVARAYYAVDVHEVLWAAAAKLQVLAVGYPVADPTAVADEVMKDLLSAMGCTMTNGVNIEDMNDERK